MAFDRTLVFAKRPAAGHVKTRLTPPLPSDEAATVYEACLRDVIARVARQRGRVEIWYVDELRAEEYFQTELPHLPARPQASGDLGARMKDAFARSFADHAERVIIIGTDAPTLPETVLNAAFDDLHEVDVVIGPSVDGGYYLIGLRSAACQRAAALFDAIAWSSAEVFRSTLARSERLGLTLRVLPGWYDIDTVEDLRRALLDAPEDSHLARWAACAEAAGFLQHE